MGSRAEHHPSHSLIALPASLPTHSFIRERDAAYDGSGEDKRGWFEFNDKVVRPFNPANLEYHTFGGPDPRARGHMLHHSAFMLIYDRVKAPLKQSPPSTEDTDGATAAAAAEDETPAAAATAATADGDGATGGAGEGAGAGAEGAAEAAEAGGAASSSADKSWGVMAHTSMFRSGWWF